MENQGNYVHDTQSWNPLGHKLVRAAFLLRLQGAETDALSAGKALMERFPRVWYNVKKSRERLRKNPKLQKLLLQQRTESNKA